MKAIFACLFAMLAAPAWANDQTVPKPAYQVLRHLPPKIIIPDVQQQPWALHAQTLCLALALYHEARNTTEHEMQAVAHVIRNRSEEDDTSVCATIWARHGADFQWVRADDLRPQEIDVWRNIQQVAFVFLRDRPDDFTRGANMFFNPRKCTPNWRKAGEVTLQLTHTFMRILHRAV